MKRETGRSFGIADGLLLVLACAAGFAATKAAFPPELTPAKLWVDLSQSLARAGDPITAAGTLATYVSILPVPFLAAWTPACLAMQLRQPRERWRRRLRGPGLMACLVGSAVVAGFAASVLVLDAVGPGSASDRTDRLYRACVMGSLVAGLAILSCWFAMGTCGVLRASGRWTDRLGRLNGVCWVVVGAAGFLSIVLGWN